MREILFLIASIAWILQISAQDGVGLSFIGSHYNYHGDNHLGDADFSASRGLGLNMRAGSRSFLFDATIDYNFASISGSPIFRSGARSTMRQVSVGAGYRHTLSRLWELDIIYNISVARLRSTIDMNGTAHGPLARFTFAGKQYLSPLVFLEVGYWFGNFDDLRSPTDFESYYRRYGASVIRLGAGYRFNQELVNVLLPESE